jgi:hypothetical protein
VKFKLDENLSPLLAPLFTSADHEAHSVVAQSLGGQPDESVIDVCSREQRALVLGRRLEVLDGKVRQQHPADRVAAGWRGLLGRANQRDRHRFARSGRLGLRSAAVRGLDHYLRGANTPPKPEGLRSAALSRGRPFAASLDLTRTGSCEQL